MRVTIFNPLDFSFLFILLFLFYFILLFFSKSLENNMGET